MHTNHCVLEIKTYWGEFMQSKDPQHNSNQKVQGVQMRVPYNFLAHKHEKLVHFFDAGCCISMTFYTFLLIFDKIFLKCQFMANFAIV